MNNKYQNCFLPFIYFVRQQIIKYHSKKQSLSNQIEKNNKEMSQKSSSRRQYPHLSLFNKNSSRKASVTSKSISDNGVQLSRYDQTVDNYRQFLKSFQDKIQRVLQKQNYRIYLNDRMNQKTYQQLLQQRQSLFKAIEQSKGYQKSANRELIEEVMSLDRQLEEYIVRNQQVKYKINSKKDEITSKKKQLKQLENQIKSYWIYSYDITNVSDSKGGGCSNQLGNNSGSHLVMNNTNSYVQLPTISPKPFNASQINTSATNQSITLFSKDLSLINNSPTRQKLIQKINQSCRQQAQNKLAYEREKISLVKMFIGYIKRIEDSQPELSDRLKLQKVARGLQDRIVIKQKKLNHIEEMIKQ